MVASDPYTSYVPRQAPPKPKPVAKPELMYLSKPRQNGTYGKIVYQTDRITKQQVLDTYAIYLLNGDMNTSSWPLFVFGENDIDKKRAKSSERDMIGGLAGVLGDYDASVSFGITTTFYRDKSVNHDFVAFKKIIDTDFDVLLRYIQNGHDIIVPSPNLQDLHGYYEKSYWKTVNGSKTQIIFHNIGTGLACIPFNYVEYIQRKFDILKQVGDKNSVQGIDTTVKCEKEEVIADDQKANEANEANEANDAIADDKNEVVGVNVITDTPKKPEQEQEQQQTKMHWRSTVTVCVSTCLALCLFLS